MPVDTILNQFEKEVKDLRRHFHRFPELSNEEFETSRFIERYLLDCGLKVHTGLAKTGVIAVLEGESDGPAIGIRSEMDALPIHEETNLEFSSQYASKMHACGHDGHMAVVLVTAKILSAVRDKIKGKIVFVFQPAEENLPEGGAKRLLEEGRQYLDGLKAIFGFHFWPQYKSGEISVSENPMMAAGDIFEVVFAGNGAHGANPHQSSDVLLMASNAILTLTSLTSRNIEPGVMATLSIGIVEGGKSPNVLPPQARIKGTTRYMSEEIKEFFPQKIRNVLDGICKAYSGSYNLNYSYGYPLLQNDKHMAGIVEKCACDIVGEAQVNSVFKPSLTSEDFALYLKNIPGCYFWVGTQKSDKHIVNSLHSPRFDLDESTLMIAVRMLLKICQQFVF